MNHITIELCAEDRARLDRIAELLDKLTPPTVRLDLAPEAFPEKPLNVKKEKKTPAEAPETAAEATETPTPKTTQPKEEVPTEAQESAKAEAQESAPWEDPAPTVTLAQIQQKVIQLAAGFGGAKKAAVREIVNAYAKKVTDLPEDKWMEVWDKLTALESEG